MSVKLRESFVGLINADSVFYTLPAALERAFVQSASCILVLNQYAMAAFPLGQHYYFFDSHAHGKQGMSDPDGKAVLASFKCTLDLHSYIYRLSQSLNIGDTEQFEITSVAVSRLVNSDYAEYIPLQDQYVQPVSAPILNIPFTYMYVDSRGHYSLPYPRSVANVGTSTAANPLSLRHMSSTPNAKSLLLSDLRTANSIPPSDHSTPTARS